jgi:hypothetical protein
MQAEVAIYGMGPQLGACCCKRSVQECAWPQCIVHVWTRFQAAMPTGHSKAAIALPPIRAAAVQHSPGAVAGMTPGGIETSFPFLAQPTAQTA